MSEAVKSTHIVFKPEIKEGWKCPACNTIHAPHVNACYCQNSPTITTTNLGGVYRVRDNSVTMSSAKTQ